MDMHRVFLVMRYDCEKMLHKTYDNLCFFSSKRKTPMRVYKLSGKHEYERAISIDALSYVYIKHVRTDRYLAPVFKSQFAMNEYEKIGLQSFYEENTLNYDLVWSVNFTDENTVKISHPRTHKSFVFEKPVMHAKSTELAKKPEASAIEDLTVVTLSNDDEDKVDSLKSGANFLLKLDSSKTDDQPYYITMMGDNNPTLEDDINGLYSLKAKKNSLYDEN